MAELLLDWLVRYGYPVVFLAATLENVFPLGFLVPGEIIVLSAALASDAASLDPVVIAVLAATGETVGELVSFTFGRVAGPRALERFSARFPRAAKPLERASDYFRRKGGWALVLGRPAWGIKATLPVVAGATEMPTWKVVTLVTVSSLYYYPTIIGLAYLLGVGLGALTETLRVVSILAALIVTLAFVVLWRRHQAQLGRAGG